MDLQNNQAEGLTGSGISKNALMGKVFGNVLVFEKILNFLIFNKGLTINRKMVQTVRLVQTSWLETTTKLLQRSMLPVILLNLDETNSLNKAVKVQNRGKHLDQYVQTFTAPKRLPNSQLPFKLTLTIEYFREENHSSLLNCLNLLGDELMEIRIKFPLCGGKLPLLFTRFTLPVLRKISFQFSCEKLQEPPYIGSNRTGLLLLQQILNACVNLQEIVILPAYNGRDYVPIHFEYLQLPVSTSTLEFRTVVNPNGLKVLLNNQLPNLKHLTFWLPNILMEDGMIFKILDRFRCSLVSLEVVGSELQTTLQFPLMEKLREIRLYGLEYIIKSQSASDLQKLLPRVKCAGLSYPAETTLAKWIQNSKIEFLSLSVVNESGSEILAEVLRAFPNIKELAIVINVSDMSDLMFLYKNMTRLKVLKIELKGELEDCRYKLESIFLGLPVWLLKVYAEKSDFFQTFLRKRRKHSLIKLLDLTTFTLCVTNPPRTLPSSLISDLLFSQALSHMPNLRILKLSKIFQPTAKMEEKWISQGRLIEYIDG